MFKKIVSQVTFSPATVEQLAHYARSVRTRQRLHGWAIVALALLILVYGVTIFLPHNPTVTPTANDLIPGGVVSLNEILSAYDTNTNDFTHVAGLLSIDRHHIATATQAGCSILDRSNYYRTGVLPYGDTEQYTYRLADDSPIYFRYVDSSLDNLSGWCGVSGAGYPFMVSAVDGNILTTALPETNAWHESLIRSHTVSTDSLSAGQLATWTLSVSNPTQQPITEDIWFATGDLAEYAHVLSVSDEGIMSGQRGHVLWPGFTLLPNETHELTVVAQGATPLDETARQDHNAHAYDCRITTVFGNSTQTPLACPAMKQVESVLHQLPLVGPTVGFILFCGLFIANGAVYLSLRLQTKELRIIRKQLNTGGF